MSGPTVPGPGECHFFDPPDAAPATDEADHGADGTDR
ncbi:hypothetical protein BH10ACT1_BH10ACT1_09600 [soil metagenome]